MKKLKTIIIDDEPDSSNLLKFELGKNCPNVEVIAVFNSSAKALPEIELLQPDLVFLDIEMPYINGFELLEKLMPVSFKVVFVTAYNQFALKAFKFNAQRRRRLNRNKCSGYYCRKLIVYNYKR